MLLFTVLQSLEVPILQLIHKHLWLFLPEILSKRFCSDFVRRGLCASVLFVRLLQGSALQCPSSGKGLQWVPCLSHFFFFLFFVSSVTSRGAVFALRARAFPFHWFGRDHEEAKADKLTVHGPCHLVESSAGMGGSLYAFITSWRAV